MASSSTKTRQTQASKKAQVLTYAAVALSIIAILISSYSFIHPKIKTVYVNTTVYLNGTSPPTTLTKYNISGTLITPPYSLASDPVINKSAPFGRTLNGINQPLNSSSLAVINKAPNSYFETAGLKYLNNSLSNQVGASANPVPAFMVNGKPSVIYFGSITCIFCGENRWAMALALSRFGNFSTLYTGYSSLGDADLPTLYWSPAHYNQSAVDLGSFYSSNYINFIAIEDTDPITGGFSLQPVATIQQEVNSTGNTAYMDAMAYLIQTGDKYKNFGGTPYAIWGTFQIDGADAVDLGNTTTQINSTYALGYMTHAQVLQQLSNPNDQFAWTEYAAADLYVAMICSTISNTAPVCKLSAVQSLEARGY